MKTSTISLSRLVKPASSMMMSHSAVLLFAVVVLVSVSLSDSASVPITLPEDLESLASSKILLDHTSTPTASFTTTSSRTDMRLNDVQHPPPPPKSNKGTQSDSGEKAESPTSSSSSSAAAPNSSSKWKNSEEMSSPLHVARCRATCLQKFSPKLTGSTTSSSSSSTTVATTADIHLLPILRSRRATDIENSSWNCILDSRDCFTCWKSCELLEPGNSKQAEHASASEKGEVNEAPTATKLDDKGEMKNQEEDGKTSKDKQSILPCSLDSKQCTPGCQVACSFYKELLSSQKEEQRRNKGSNPVVATRQDSVVRIIPGRITWPVEASNPNSDGSSAAAPVVYVVIQEYPDRKWRQIAQTTRAEIEIPKELTSAMKTKLRYIRVFVVHPEGLLAVYSPARVESGAEQEHLSDDNNNNSLGKVAVEKVGGADNNDASSTTPLTGQTQEIVTNVPDTRLPSAGSSTQDAKVEGDVQTTISPSEATLGVSTSTMTTTTAAAATTTTDGVETFELRLVSLIHQKSLVIAELRWNQIGANPSQEYLITWELTGGGLKGHLVTDSTSVTLSLWPDTHYRIQVELFEQNLDSDGEQPAESSALSLKSLPLTVDTSEASFPIGSPSALLGSTDEDDYGEHGDGEDESEQDENETEEEEEEPAHKSITGFLNMTLVLGISISALVFVLVILTLAAFTWTRMRAVSSANNSPVISPSKESGRLESRDDDRGCCYNGCFASSFSSTREPRLLLSQEDLWEDSSIITSFSSPAYHSVDLGKSGREEDGSHMQYSMPEEGLNEEGRTSVAMICSTTASSGEAHSCPYFNYYYGGAHSFMPQSAKLVTPRAPLPMEGEQGCLSSNQLPQATRISTPPFTVTPNTFYK